MEVTAYSARPAGRNAAETLLGVGVDAAPAIVCGDCSITYGELRDQVARAGGAWRALGLVSGERAMICAPDSIDWVVAYLGAIWAGGVAVGVNPRLPAAELLPILIDSEAAFVWCEAERATELVGCARLEFPSLDVVCPTPVAGCADWSAAMNAASPVEPSERNPEDPALWIGTSGTTGMPKGVVHAQRVVDASDAFAQGVLGVTAADRLYATSKLFFAYALGNSLFAGLRRGATVIFDREWPTPERVEEMVATHHPSVLFCVPTLYRKMLAAGAAVRLADSGVRHFVSAGEALPAAMRAAWREATGRPLVNGYGTSETLCLMLYGDDDSGCMRPTPLTEVRCDRDLGPDQPQRVWIRAATVAKGYWRRPEAEADGFCDGWFSPGDVFLYGPGDGFVYGGRNDDMLKIAGQWVSTLWVEQALAAAGGEALAQIAVVAVTTCDGLGALAALAVAMPDACPTARQRLTACIEALPGHRRPRWVHWLDSLPLTATGKTQRGALRVLHEQALGRLPSPDTGAPRLP